MILFLVDYRTKSDPPETFTAGQVVEERDPASELHFVSRRVAAFVGEDGRLTDAYGREVDRPDTEAAPAAAGASPADPAEPERAAPVAVTASAVGKPSRAAKA